MGGDGDKGDPGDMGDPGDTGGMGDPGTPAPVDRVALPGATFFPESINASANGTLYVTSVFTGEVVTISPDRQTVAVLIGEEAAQPAGKTGVFLDEAIGDLWTCAIATDFSVASELRRYALATGALKTKFPLINNGVCNDIAMDAAGNVYVTDSFSGIQRLQANATAMDATMWSTSVLYQPAAQGNFAIDGIVLDGTDLYVNNLDKGTLIRVPLLGGGVAGTPVQLTGVSLVAPDGMRLSAAHTIISTQAFANSVSKIVVNPATNSGTVTTLSNRLDRPSAVVVSQGAVWVTEGQIAKGFGLESGTVNIPFLVRRVELF